MRKAENTRTARCTIMLQTIPFPGPVRLIFPWSIAGGRIYIKKAMYVYALECELEKLDGGEKDDTCQHLTLYVLRRNFWTWLEALSTLTDMEKRYIMGHEMIVDKHSIRSSYNDERKTVPRSASAERGTVFCHENVRVTGVVLVVIMFRSSIPGRCNSPGRWHPAPASYR